LKRVALGAISGGESGGLSGVDFTGSGALGSFGSVVIRRGGQCHDAGHCRGRRSAASLASVAASAVGAGGFVVSEVGMEGQQPNQQFRTPFGSQVFKTV
jgi:hypothetical protein